MQSFFNYIGTAVPENKIAQSDIADFMSNALQMDSTEKKKLEILYRASGIRTRHSVLADYARKPEDFEFFPQNQELLPFPDISSRMRLYEREASSLAVKAIRNAVPSGFDYSTITHLITISCTGMYAPGLDVEIVQKLSLDTTVKRTAINFMGCYGAFNGFKLASSICQADPEAKVLLAAVELCTLHFQNDKEPDTLLSNALFSDGAAAAMISAEETPGALRMDGFHSDMAYEGKTDMAWKIGNHGFEMRLTSIVPDIIEKHIKPLTDKLLNTLNVSRKQIDLFAIHPGGKRILEVIEQQLSIPAGQNMAAHEILRAYGNMSSPTILFVLQKIFSNIGKEDKGKKMLSFAFG
ncbi:MAG: type III polyketide synthase, partial [Cyclobacteriaceae bacterium]